MIVTMYAGRTDTKEFPLPDAFARAVATGADCTRNAVSVSIEDVQATEWAGAVCWPGILSKQDTLYKKTGYNSP